MTARRPRPAPETRAARTGIPLRARRRREHLRSDARVLNQPVDDFAAVARQLGAVAAEQAQDPVASRPVAARQAHCHVQRPLGVVGFRRLRATVRGRQLVAVGKVRGEQLGRVDDAGAVVVRVPAGRDTDVLAQELRESGLRLPAVVLDDLAAAVVGEPQRRDPRGQGHRERCPAVLGDRVVDPVAER